MNIEQDRAVLIHYHLTDSEGNVIDSSQGSDEPLAYLHGHGNLVSGVENALAGRSAGDKLDVVVPPEDGYGVRDPALDVAIPLEAFPEEARADLEPGIMFQAPHPADEDQVAVFTIMERLEDAVHCTANHPLAGVTLHFNLEIVEVREATEEEISVGHVHGQEDHQH